MNTDSRQLLDWARQVLAIEAEAVRNLAAALDERFARACRLILDSKGRVIVCGMGKSGHIGRKIAATLASTGTPAFFVHPAEAAHGDLGMIVEGDIVLLISNSGESEELLAILPALKRKQAVLIAVTARTESSLARHSSLCLPAAVAQEACPHGLAPTSSTTAVLALGDALAVALLRARAFTPDDFALSHPAGSLGKRLLLTVADVMHSGDGLPVVAPETNFSDLIVCMSEKRLGMVAVADAEGYLKGIFTDGDLRRLLQKRSDFPTLTAADIMSADPSTILPERLASEALTLMQRQRVNGLPVCTADGRLVGALNMHDLFAAGVAV